MTLASILRTVVSFSFSSILALAPLNGAEVTGISGDPAPDPGDLFENATIDPAGTSPIQGGFDLRDTFGGQFSVVEPGRTVFADNTGAPVQEIYFHTAVPVPLGGYALFLGDDPFGRGTSKIEVILTSQDHVERAVLSSVTLPSPYPAPVGSEQMRRIRVSDTFPTVMGQYFLLRLTPVSSQVGVRVIEFDGHPPAGLLASSNSDFTSTVQGHRGWQYGFYQTPNATEPIPHAPGTASDDFSVANMTANGTNWNGNEAFATPSHSAIAAHPGTANLKPAVRRYTVGTSGEPLHTGPVLITGQFFDLAPGATSGFVTVDGTRRFGPVAISGEHNFAFMADVAPGSTIDIGVTAGNDHVSDTTGVVAHIVVPSGLTLASALADYSIAGFTSTQTTETQNPVNGFKYGYYDTPDATTGAFITNGMNLSASGPFWSGSAGFGTPGHNYRGLHPGVNGTAAVRRYTVGEVGELDFTGTVRVVGRFFDVDTGNTDAFITVDPDGDAGPAPRTLLLPISPVRGLVSVAFDLITTVAPGTTIDFGALPTADGGFSDSTGFYGWIVSANAAVPTDILANVYNSTNSGVAGSSTDHRALAFSMAMDGVIGATDETSFDTAPGTGFPYQFAGLLYLEAATNPKATRFDAIRIDVTTSADFSDIPRIYLLRQNVDPGSSNPAADDRYTRLPVAPVRVASNSAGQPAYTFDLTALPANERTGYGFAVVGSGTYTGGAISVSELTATAERVDDSGVIGPAPFLVTGPDGHRYGLSIARGDWEQAEASAVSAGGHLVTINNAQENAFIIAQFTPEALFIGLKQDGPDAATEPSGGWRWRTGEQLSDVGAFVNWSAGQPDAAEGPDEDFSLMGHASLGTGWADVRVGGLQSASSYRGVIELPEAAGGPTNFYLPQLVATSNIFDAGLPAPTQGGALPASISVTGLAGEFLTFPQIAGLLNTAADSSGPDGAHTPGRSCNLAAVGGISGYVNGNNTPALVGVFLGDQQPAQAPPALDFSRSAIGEDFAILAPQLGQVFFIGDGFTSGSVAQQFVIPEGATRLFFGFPDGNNGTFYHGAPAGYANNTGSMTIRASAAPSLTPVFLDQQLPTGGATLAVVGGEGPYTFSLVNGTLPAGVSLSANGVVSGQPGNGAYVFTIRATDARNRSADQVFTGSVENPVPAPNGLIAWWPGDERGVEIINGEHVEIAAGSPAFTSGVVGRAFSFDGATDQAVVTSAARPLDALNRLPSTIEAWVKPELRSDGASDFPTNAVSSDRQNFGGHGFGVNVWNGGSELKVAYHEGFRIVPGVTFSAGEWYHIAIAYSAGNVTSYVNGELRDSVDFTQDSVDGSEIVRIGRHNEDTSFGSRRFFKGAIDEVAIYDRALSPSEVTVLHASGSGGKLRHDLSRDFSFALPQPSERLWTYGQFSPGTISPSSFALYTQGGTGNPLGSLTGAGESASIVLNTSATTHSVVGAGGTEIRWAPGEVSMHPGPSGSYGVARWTAPADGTYSVSASFRGLDAQGVSTDIHVYHGSNPIFNGLVSNAFLGNAQSFTGIVFAAQGDTVDFVVGANGAASYDTTGLFASVVRIGDLLAPASGLTIATQSPPTIGRQWLFTATRPNDIPDLSLRVQIAEANAPAVWTDLDLLNGTNAMTPPEIGSDQWSLAVTPFEVPVGNYFFRVMSSTPDQETPTAAFGAEALGGLGTGAIAISTPGEPPPPPPLAGLPPVTSLIVKIGGKNGVTSTQQGKVFDFTAIQPVTPALPVDMRVRVQHSFTPAIEGSWQSLPDATMDLIGTNRKGRIYRLVTSNIPTTDGRPVGEQGLFFRALTSADNRLPTPGPVVLGVLTPLGPFIVAGGPLWEYVLATHESSSDASGATAYVGDLITYRIKFRNGGTAPATDVLVTLSAPSGTTVVSHDNLDVSASAASRVKWMIPSVPVGLEVEKFIVVRVKAKIYSTVKLLASQSTVKCDEISSVQAVPERGSFNLPLETRVVPGLRLLGSVDSSAPAGGLLDYELIAENPSAEVLKDGVATFRIPLGTAVEFLRTREVSGDFTGTAFPNPSPSSNPSLEVYAPGERQLIRWNLGDLPPQSQRRMRFTLRVLFDLPSSFSFRGEVQRTSIHATDYNLEAKLLTGAKLTVFKGDAPGMRVNVTDAAPPTPPPAISLVKTASADGALAGEALSQTAKTYSLQTSGVSEVATAIQNSRIVYSLHFSNAPGAGAGRNVTIHDEIPKGVTFKGFIRLNDTLINSAFGFTFLNEDGDVIPSGGEPVAGDFNDNGRIDRGEYTDTNGNRRYDAFTDTRFIDYNLGMLAGGESGKLSYEVAATSEAGTAIESLSSGALIPKTRGGLQYAGYSITSENLLLPIAGSPKRVIAVIVPPATLNVQNPILLSSTLFPGGEISWEIPYHVNGGDGLAFQDARISLMLPKHYNLVAGSTYYVDTTLPIEPGTPRPARAILPGETAPSLAAPEADGRRKLTFHLGNLPGKDPNNDVQPGLGRSGVVRVTFSVPDPAPAELLTEEGFVKVPPFIRPEMNGSAGPDPAQALRMGLQRVSTAGLEKLLLPPSSAIATAPLMVPAQADVAIGRVAPISVDKLAPFTITIFYGNITSVAARNGIIAMQLPYGTEFVSAAQGKGNLVQSDGTESPVFGPAYELLPNARKPETIVWRFPENFSAHEGGAVSVTLKVKEDFGGNSIQDKSCYLGYENATGRVAPPLSIHVRQKNLFTAFAEAIGAFMGDVFGNFNPEAKRVLEGHVISDGSRQISLAGAGHIDVMNGTKVLPLGDGRVLAVGSLACVIPNDDWANEMANDGGARVIVGHGYGSHFEVKGVPLPGRTVWQPGDIINGLRNPATSLVAAGGGNLVAAGGMNLVAAGGMNLIDNDTGAMLNTRVSFTNANLVAAGGGNLVAAGGGNLVAAGGGNLIGNDGSTLVAAGAGNLVGNDGASLVAAGGGNILCASVGLTARGNGLTVLAQDVPKLLGISGGALTTAAGLSIKASAAPLRFASLIGLDGATLIGNDGSTLVAAGGMNLAPRATVGLIGNDGSTFK